MDNNNTNTNILCTAGCGFFGNPSFNNMCSRCYKSKETMSKDDTTVIPAIEKSRKHLRSPSPENTRTNSAPASSIASPSNTNEEKPVQTNKGRCFKCRLKVSVCSKKKKKLFIYFFFFFCMYRFLWLNRQQINVDVGMSFVIRIGIQIDMTVISIMQNWTEVNQLLFFHMCVYIFIYSF